MNTPKINADQIPQHDRERLGAALLKATRDAFKDPKIKKEFADWQERKKLKDGQLDRPRELQNLKN